MGVQHFREAVINREKTPHPLHSMLRYQGEPTLRYLAEMCIKRAEALEQEAATERKRGRRYLEAAEARAAEKQDRKAERTARRQAAQILR